MILVRFLFSVFSFFPRGILSFSFPFPFPFLFLSFPFPFLSFSTATILSIFHLSNQSLHLRQLKIICLFVCLFVCLFLFQTRVKISLRTTRQLSQSVGNGRLTKERLSIGPIYLHLNLPLSWFQNLSMNFQHTESSVSIYLSLSVGCSPYTH